MKKNIPNILTGLRIVLTPIIIVLGIFDNIKLVILLALIAAFTDIVDGYLARKWNTVSLIGAKLDTIADKIFAIGLIACLITKFSFLFYPFMLEIIIAITNLINYLKYNTVKSLVIGKLKTIILFIGIILGIISNYNQTFIPVMYIFIYMTIILQIICLLMYLFSNQNIKKPT
ncbi:MAG: CDP-alcohol phosphatidyltransferase family protein [Bacilli bacterium]